MNNEIKEIIDKLKLLCYDDYCLEVSVDYIERKEEKILLDYITNLQEKVNQYENPDDLTLYYMWLDEKAKDKMKKLQGKNERLNNIINELEKWVEEQIKISQAHDNQLGVNVCNTFKNKLNELKGDSSNV